MAGKSKTDAAVDAAIKAGNWDKASPAAKATLEKAGAKLRAAREVKPHEPEQSHPPRLSEFTFLAKKRCGAVYSWPALDFSKCPPPHRRSAVTFLGSAGPVGPLVDRWQPVARGERHNLLATADGIRSWPNSAAVVSLASRWRTLLQTGTEDIARRQAVSTATLGEAVYRAARTRSVSAAGLSPTSGEVVTQFQLDRARTDSPVRILHGQPGSLVRGN